MEHEMEVEVFRAGDYGPRGAYSEQDLERIASDYQPGAHEAPVTIDHRQEGPALGWVRSLRRAGDLLLARLGGLNADFVEQLRAGAFKKRSIELYRTADWTGRPYLRSLTFLGACPPAVKGLADPVFAEADNDSWIEFEEGDGLGGDEAGRDGMDGTDGTSGTDGKNGKDGKNGMEMPEAGCDGDCGTDSDGDRDSDSDSDVSDQSDLTDPSDLSDQSDWSDKAEDPNPSDLSDLSDLIDPSDLVDSSEMFDEPDPSVEFRDSSVIIADPEVARFCDQLRAEGRSLPTWDQRGIERFLSALDDATPLQFAEFDGAQPQTARGWFQDFLRALPVLVPMGEAAAAQGHAPRYPNAPVGFMDCNGVRVDPDSLDLHQRVVRYLEACPQASYGDAIRAVARA